MNDLTFEDEPAVRGYTPQFVGIAGPSGSGKTLSALRMAAGMQRVTGGDVFLIDNPGNPWHGRPISSTDEHGPVAIRYAALSRSVVVGAVGEVS